jgi:hypothetical protein
MKNSSSLAPAVGFLAFISGLILLADPKCRHGCKTVAEHLIVSGARLFTGQA